MAGTVGDIFTGPGTPGPPAPTNQVYTNKFNDAEPFARRDFPDSEMVAAHRRVFEEIMHVEEVDPPYYMGLDPDGRYEGIGAAEHQGPRPIWTMTGARLFVAPVFSLIRELAAITDFGTLVPGEVYHSHWKGLKGGAQDQLVLVNTGKGGWAGSGGRNILAGAEDVAEILALAPDDEKRIEWLKKAAKELTEAR